jgi:hypothetical protein
LETFTEPKAMVDNPRYSQDREAALAALDLGTIDEPIVDIITAFAALPHCFTLQSCCGHFVCVPEQDPRTLDDVPLRHAGLVRYRIAYFAVCMENGRSGRALAECFRRVAAIDPDYVQFGSADWFWERWANSYALQVEPLRYMKSDEVVLQHEEALHVQHTRDLFFAELRRLAGRELNDRRGGLTRG